MSKGFTLVRQAVGALTTLFAGLSALGVLALTIITIVNVVMRNTTGGGFENMVGLGEVGVAAVALLGVAHAQRSGAHIRSTLVVDRVPEKVREICELVWRLIALALVVWLTQATWERAQLSMEISESRFGTVAIWPARLLIAASFALLALQLLVEIVDRTLIVLGVRGPEEGTNSEQEVLEVTL